MDRIAFNKVNNANWIHSILLKTGINQRQLAQSIGVSSKAVEYWRTEVNNMSPRSRILIELMYGPHDEQ